MMAQRHLHELLREDQEPFHLKDYIATKRCQIKRSKSTMHLNKIIKPNNIIQTSTSKLSICKHACFFSFTDSPEVRRSPFPSPAKSPSCKSPNKIFLQILEAAARIQKQSSVKPKNQINGTGFGLFGSILKRLNRIKKREIGVDEARVFAKQHGEQTWKRKWEKVKENMDEKSTGYETMGLSCSCSHSHSHSRLSSAGWSEEKDMESSSCSSPSSPFRFSLQRSTSTGSRTPEFLSPARRSKEEERNNYEENLQKVEVEEEEEEEKEQCSPVSVLDPPFEDDENGHEDGAEEEDVDDYDHECSYAIVQKVKQQLLQKLRRFERLAELDPIELEKRMLEEQDDDDEDDHEETEFADEESLSSYEEQESAEIVIEVFSKTNSHYLRKIPADMNTLVLDLISEEKRNGVDDSEVVVKRVCKKLDSWKEVESNTIDMMVELDFRREVDGWKKNDQEQIRETAMKIEFGIFGLLMEELSEELVSLAGS